MAGIRGIPPGPGASAGRTVATPPSINASTQRSLTTSERERLQAELARLQSQ